MWFVVTGRPSDPAQIILLTLAINYVSEVREGRYAGVVISFEYPQGVDTTLADIKTQDRHQKAGDIST